MSLEALQAFGNRRGGVGRRDALLLLLLLGWCGAEALRHVGHDGEAHGDVEPVEQVLGVGVEVQRQVADVVAAVGEEGDGLVGLHALGDEQVEQAPFGFGVVGLDEREALGRPVRRGGPAGDHLAPPVPAGLLLAGVDVATVEADEQGQVRAALPRPDLPLLVSLDGGYVHSSQQQSRRDGWCEVIAGRATPADGPAKCFAFVQTYDTKPKRRLFDLLISQGMQANQAVTFLTDGGDDVRDLPLYLNPDSEHLLDWFHVTMRLTVMTNMAKSLRAAPPEEEEEEEGVPPAGRPRRGGCRRPAAPQVVLLARQRLPGAADRRRPRVRPRRRRRRSRAAQAVQSGGEFAGYLRANAASIPNYGERYRAGEVISSSSPSPPSTRSSASGW